MRTPLASGLAVVALAAAAPPAAAATYSVYPSPGVFSASAQTTISFRGATAAELGRISVSGSRSGRHTGRLRPHPDGLGVSFVPTHRFQEGERVTVRTTADIIGAHGGDWGFTVGVRKPRAPRPVENPAIGRGAVQSYQSRPDLTPPAVSIDTVKPGRAPGLVFLAPKAGRGQDGAMIIDDAGKLVWFRPAARGTLAADFRVQTFEGKPVLTWWEGRLFLGDGDGVGQIFDSGYRRIATVRGGNGLLFDLHEFTITPRGTALITVYQRVERDLRPWHGLRRARAVDSIVQEIDIRTGLVLFEWHSLGNVSMNESLIPPPTQPGGDWDYMHINSAALANDGNFIVSGRNTSAIYKVSRATGRILWRLGGKRSTFKMGPGTHFAWQHSAREQPDGTLELYDNAAAPAVRKHSRVITLRLDAATHTATLARAFTHPRGLLAASQGDVQSLPNGDTFVGFGSQRWFTEFSPTGQVLFDGHLALGNDSYRAFRFPWSARPADAPRLAATTSGGRVTARASWNGATGVARWQLLAGPNTSAMSVIGEAPATGFETAISAATAAPFVAVRALDAQRTQLATSGAISPAGATAP